MVDGVAVPEGLATMSPGPELAALLAGLDVGRVGNDDVVDVLIAQSRQLSHEQARLFSAMNEVIHRLPFAAAGEVLRAEGPVEHGADEVRAALSWTRRAADFETDLAHILVARLPMVFQALLTGVIDRGKAVVFARYLADLSELQIAAICRAVLPQAGGWTTGQLAARLRQLIIRIDPEFYERRYRKAVRERRVCGYLDADGTATINGSGLPAEDAAAALERVDDLARAVRRAGHPATLDQLRADLFLGLLDGTLQGMSRDEIVTALLLSDVADAAPERTLRVRIDHMWPAGAPGTGPDGAEPDGTGPDGGGPGGPHGGPGDGPTGGSDRRPEGELEGEWHGTTDRAQGAPEAGTGAGADGEPGNRPRESNRKRSGTAAGGTSESRVGVEIRVALSTLLGSDQHPGEIPGLGPVPASAARTAVHRQRRAEWRWAVVDGHGRLITEGITRRRPAHLPRDGPRGGVVELHVRREELALFTQVPQAAGPWVGVVGDIAEQFARRHEHLREIDSHPRARFPRAALRRHTQIRDRTCVHKGCRMAARRCDLDHTLDHARGGGTTADDLAPTCRHHHMLKTEGGWRLAQPEPGRFVWTSPLGREYHVRPAPLIPPEIGPRPRAPESWFDEPASDDDRPLVLRGWRPRPAHNPHDLDHPEHPDLDPQPFWRS